jgi:ferredoxin
VAGVHIAIDRDACIGAANCTRLARGAFALDDDGLAVVIDPGAANLETLRSAEASCPSGAISIEPDEL